MPDQRAPLLRDSEIASRPRARPFLPENEIHSMGFELMQQDELFMSAEIVNKGQIGEAVSNRSISPIPGTMNPEPPSSASIRKEPDRTVNVSVPKLRVSLDYTELKEFLRSSGDILKMCATIQALRWRVSKSRHRDSRKVVLLEYVGQDLLECAKPEEAPSAPDQVGGKLEGQLPIIDRLVGGALPRSVQEYAVSFVNALASEGVGRKYLLRKRSLITHLVGVLHGEGADTPMRQSALGAL